MFATVWIALLTTTCTKIMAVLTVTVAVINICHQYQSSDGVAVVQVMRLFVGEPVWTPHNRPQEENPSRMKYLQQFGNAQAAAA